MICCINPNCPHPENQDGQKYCITCGVKLVPILRGRFRTIKFIAQGGFGRTYLAEDIDRLNQRCVVKQLAASVQGTWAINKAAELFQQEARQLQQLGQHPQIPSLNAYFEQDNYLYFVQQFVDGDDLLKLFQNRGIWQEKQVKQLLLQLLPVLKFIHEQKIIHRDIKPENIMRRRCDGVLMLIDFGVSKQLSGTVMSRLGTQIGSHGYAPLEQMQGGEAYAASDLFSLGATAFHLLTGVHPFRLWTEHGYSWTANWQQHLKSPLDTGLELILSKLLAKDIEQRYQSAEEVLTDFQRQSIPISGSILTLAPILTPAPTLQRFDFEVIAVDVRGNITNRQRHQAQFISEDLGSGIILEMIAIPGGSFVMGSPNNEAERNNDEGPQHNVDISPFFMGKYQVTQEQWEAVMGYNPSRFKGGAKRPVEQVSWNNVLEFCQKLSQKTGNIYRLPWEAEWEYACRAGTTTPFYFGDTITPDLVNYDGNYPYAGAPKGLLRQQTTDVGSFPPNPFGLYDMHGNVWEWCSDCYQDHYNDPPNHRSSWEKGTHPSRVQRGGSWINSAVYCRSAYRDRYPAGLRHSNLGFRVAMIFV